MDALRCKIVTLFLIIQTVAEYVPDSRSVTFSDTFLVWLKFLKRIEELSFVTCTVTL